MLKKVLSVVLLAFLVSLAGAQTRETFLLTFVPNVQFSPLYVAIERGFFADIADEIDVQYLNEPDVVDLVALGSAKVGIVSGEQVLLSATRGRDIVYVYSWFQRYPIGVVVDADSDITSAEDLRGRVVGIPGRFGASYSGLTALLLANGMTESDIQLEEIGFNAPEVFCLGRVEASVVYSNNEPLQIRNRAQAGECGDVRDVRVLEVSETVDLVANGIVTSRALLERDPDAVRALVAAWHGGLTIAIQNPARAYLDSLPYVENLPMNDALRAELERLSAEQEAFLATSPSREAIAESRLAMNEALHAQFDAKTLLQWDVLLATIVLWDSETLGESTAVSWQAMQDTLLSMGLLNAPLNLDALYSNDFVPSDEE
jgi:NitT/TauT family transport system substrate-binding protein